MALWPMERRPQTQKDKMRQQRNVLQTKKQDKNPQEQLTEQETENQHGNRDFSALRLLTFWARNLFVEGKLPCVFEGVYSRKRGRVSSLIIVIATTSDYMTPPHAKRCSLHVLTLLSSQPPCEAM